MDGMHTCAEPDALKKCRKYFFNVRLGSCILGRFPAQGGVLLCVDE